MTPPGLNEAVETAGVGVERYLPNRDTRSATGRKRREKRPGKRHGSGAERYMSNQESARSGSGNGTRDDPVAHIHTWAVKRSELEA